MTAENAGPPAPLLAAIRSRWLAAATAALRDDPQVAGAALVGSLGAGRADDWSDVDLLVFVDDARIDDGVVTHGLGKPALTFDARHNGPRGTRAISGQYLVDGLPLWADWHLHPVSRASWPADAAVIFDRRAFNQHRLDQHEVNRHHLDRHGFDRHRLDRRGFDRLPVTFAELLAAGEREPPTRKSPADHRALQLALIPIAGKRLARRSPETARMIEFVGGPYAPEATWADHLTTLRQLLGGFAALGLPASVAAAHAHLDLVADALG
ncbi:nucleotidyltransferase domain-containing protein [Nonomuraea zeae]|uniref:Nucleotidyltransferase domain-containing protein n=1 Tax=Nonomuraea zeae TaxID=1642303 RepID=A0A5S4FH50_9ACTN|nr:nucleotidyltransferase domain-containing protein [Nonomuraea zeae]TMR19273.1 nucleotidyltransferase domain-containing protein [Nonomuraea zeae]